MALPSFTGGLPSSAPQYGYPSLEAVPKPSFYDALPSSGPAAIQRADSDQAYGATGKSMGYVSVGITMMPFAGQYSFVRDPGDGQFVFSVPLPNLKGDQAAVITVDSLNAVLKDGWSKCMAIMQGAVANRLYTQDEFEAILNTPTSGWRTLDFIEERWRRAETDTSLGLEFLCPDFFVDNYVPMGWIRGNGPAVTQTPQVTVRVSGSLESVENIWGDKILTGDRLFFILKRVFNARTGLYEHFAMVPWAGRGVDPSLADATYMDITGRLAVGRVFFIGTLETWMEHELINDALLPGYLSLEERRFKGLQDRQPSCLRVTSNGRPHTSLPYLLY